jgi:hypothetical protein
MRCNANALEVRATQSRNRLTFFLAKELPIDVKTTK